MNLRFIAAALLLAAVPLTSFPAEKEPKKPESPNTTAETKPAPEHEKKKDRPKPLAPGLRPCSLTLTWWEEPKLQPGETLELALLEDKKETPLAPLPVMGMNYTLEYVGTPTVTILRKARLSDPASPGKTFEKWVPYATFGLGDQESAVLAVLFPAGEGKVSTKTFDISTGVFPYGSFHILNYTKARIGCSLGGKVFFTEPGQRAKSPLVLSQRTVVNFRLGAFESDGTQVRLYATPLIMDERSRRLYFVAEQPIPEGEEHSRKYITFTLVEYMQDHVREAPPEEGGKAVAGGNKKAEK